MLVKLEAKGFIKHRAEGLRYVYSPTTSRAAAQKKAVSQLMRVFFGGSASEAAAALLKQEQWSDDELEALRAQIEQVRKNGGSHDSEPRRGGAVHEPVDRAVDRRQGHRDCDRRPRRAAGAHGARVGASPGAGDDVRGAAGAADLLIATCRPSIDVPVAASATTLLTRSTADDGVAPDEAAARPTSSRAPPNARCPACHVAQWLRIVWLAGAILFLVPVARRCGASR